MHERVAEEENAQGKVCDRVHSRQTDAAVIFLVDRVDPAEDGEEAIAVGDDDGDVGVVESCCSRPPDAGREDGKDLQTYASQPSLRQGMVRRTCTAKRSVGLPETGSSFSPSSSQ